MTLLDHCTPQTLHPLLLAPKPTSAAAAEDGKPKPPAPADGAQPLLRMTIISKPPDFPLADFRFEVRLSAPLSTSCSIFTHVLLTVICVVQMQLRPLLCVYNPVFTSAMYTFFSSTRDLDTDHLRAVARGWTEQKQSGRLPCDVGLLFTFLLCSLFSFGRSEFVQSLSGVRRGQLSFRLAIDGPTLLVPTDVCRTGSDLFVAQLGQVVFSSLDSAATASGEQKRQDAAAAEVKAAAPSVSASASASSSTALSLLEPVRAHPHSYDSFALNLTSVQLTLLMQQPVVAAPQPSASASGAAAAPDQHLLSAQQLLSSAVLHRAFALRDSASDGSARARIVCVELVDRFDVLIGLFVNVDTPLQRDVHEQAVDPNSPSAAAASATSPASPSPATRSPAAGAKASPSATRASFAPLPRVIVQSSLPSITLHASSSVYYALLRMRSRVTDIKRENERARDQAWAQRRAEEADPALASASASVTSSTTAGASAGASSAVPLTPARDSKQPSQTSPPPQARGPAPPLTPSSAFLRTPMKAAAAKPISALASSELQIKVDWEFSVLRYKVFNH